MLGEARYAEGRFAEAVALWGHTMLQLPADPSADTIRHKLLARMGYGLLQANAATGDPSYLADGQAMCELYLARHEELFGNAEDAQAQRGEIYELLYEFDSRLDQLGAEDDLGAAQDEAESDRVAAADTTVDEDDDVDESIETEEGEVRLINVRRIAWADPDDPRVRAFLRDKRFTGPSMLDNRNDVMTGPRVLVRAGAVPRALGDGATLAMRKAARTHGLALIETARPALAHCYEVAMAREFVPATRVELELTVEPDGTVSHPQLVDGGLVDAIGDVCAAEALRELKLPEVTLTESLAVWVPIHFFFQDAAMASELSVRGGSGDHTGYEGAAQKFDLPSIDAFAPGAEQRLLIVGPETLAH